MPGGQDSSRGVTDMPFLTRSPGYMMTRCPDNHFFSCGISQPDDDYDLCYE